MICVRPMSVALVLMSGNAMPKPRGKVFSLGFGGFVFLDGSMGSLELWVD